MKSMVVTAADDQFYPLVVGMIASVRANSPPGTIEIGVLDTGLLDWQIKALASQVDHIIKPGPTIEFPGSAAASKALRAVINKPFVRDFFPGYELYLWIDADAWVQDREAIATYLTAASTRQLIITPEIHRHYLMQFQEPKAIRPREYDIYCLGWGEAQAARMIGWPLFNTGAFAIHNNSVAWAEWIAALKMLSQRITDFFIEQTALNGAILTGRIPVISLPAHFNWMCHWAMPIVDIATNELIEPGYPRQKLSVVHLTANTKFQPVDIKLSDGRNVQMSLRYPLQIAQRQ